MAERHCTRLALEAIGKQWTTSFKVQRLGLAVASSHRSACRSVTSTSSAGLVAKINQRDHKGHTAIDLAIALGHKEVETLLSAYIARAAARQRPRGCPLLQMPVEVLVLILSWLEPRDLCTAAQACTVPKPLCVHVWLARSLRNPRACVCAGACTTQPRGHLVAAIL